MSFASSLSSKPLGQRPRWVAHRPDKGSPLFVGKHGNGNPTIVALTTIHRVRAGAVVTIPPASGNAAVHRVIEHGGGNVVDAALELRKVDPLAFAGSPAIIQRRGQKRGADTRSEHVSVRAVHHAWTAVRPASDLVIPGKRGRHVAVAGVHRVGAGLP